jgi:uncharacterized membrane protein
MVRSMQRFKRPLQWVLAATMTVGGLAHFASPDAYVAIMPPFLPFPLALVYVSGVVEAGLGIALMIPKLTRLAAWGLVLTLLAVYPANIYHAVEGGISHPDLPEIFAEPVFAYIRLPFQVLFIAWAWWYTTPAARADQ